MPSHEVIEKICREQVAIFDKDNEVYTKLLATLPTFRSLLCLIYAELLKHNFIYPIKDISHDQRVRLKYMTDEAADDKLSPHEWRKLEVGLYTIGCMIELVQ